MRRKKQPHPEDDRGQRKQREGIDYTIDYDALRAECHKLTQALLSALSTSSWIAFHRAFKKAMPLDEAYTLSVLVDLEKQFQYTIQSTDRWFYCTAHKLEKETDFKAHAQTRILNNLKKQKLIEINKQGMPARRHIRINASAVAALIVAYEINLKSQRSSTRNGASSSTRNGATGATRNGATPNKTLGK